MGKISAHALARSYLALLASSTRLITLFPSVVLSGVAGTAERNQILFCIVARVAAKFLVVNFQVRHPPARLTPPAVATQYLLPKNFIRCRIQPQGYGPWAERAHEAFSFRLTRNACLCSPGRNWKNLLIENSSISGSPWSRFAPARKSAQIISRQ